MRGMIYCAAVVLLVLGVGIWMQADLNVTVEECAGILEQADRYCEQGEYALSLTAAERFCRLWREKEALFAYLYKYELYADISEAACKIVPLLTEKNLSEYRGLCLETAYHLRLFQTYETFGAGGIL